MLGPAREYPPSVLAALPPPLHTALAPTILRSPTGSQQRRRPPTETQLAYTISPLLTATECASLISLTEASGYVPALLNVGGGYQVHSPDVRRSLRRIVDSPSLSAALWSRLSPFVPSVLGGRRVVGLNERLRFLKYVPGDRFAPHSDGTYVRADGSAMSVLTVQVYLNAGCGGGRTNVWFEEEGGEEEAARYGCELEAGKVFVFDHGFLHEGEVLTEGVKYTIRTDIMYEMVQTESPIAGE
ncbi:hypothetical protein DFJ73DRAFT_879312 [Zopfochytrium polystomum]|nr:hypothetical protein DFJ73DRAFT_879312 [Zopfochytrium polystomum]